ncbi:MAG: hypothetical protein IZT60_03105 [Gammaproteobacteria bacterium]|nr:hypothetical protein [Gammaproteobacteria bacterium]
MNRMFDRRRFMGWMFLSICIASGALPAAVKEKYTVEMVLLEKPPFQYFAADGVVQGKKPHIRLEMKAESANRIIDEEAWFSDNELHLGSSEKVPPHVAGAIDGHKLVRAIPGSGYLSLVYADDQDEGRYLFLWSMKSRRYEYGFDFGSYLYAPGETEIDKQVITQSIDWVIVKGSVLYISHSHKTYASSSRDMNAYITAIDLNSRKLLWRSEPLVSNAANFDVVGNTIISGYGFSAEPDYLYLLDTSNGRQIEKIALRTGPQYIISKDDLVFVRTYNTDYVFRVMHPLAVSEESPQELPVESEEDSRQQF